MRLSADLHGLADGQKGLVRTDQLHGCGYSDKAIHRLTTAGALHARHHGVHVVGRPGLDQAGEYLAAVFALGPDAALSHHSVAAHAGLVDPGGAVHVTVPDNHGRQRRDDIRVHRQRLRPEERTTLGGVPCTALVRTILDLADSAPRLLEHAFEEAQIQYRLRPVDVAAALVTRPGHRGTARIRTVLDGAVDPQQVQSILELRFLQLCATYGLPTPLTQVWFGPYRVDFLFVEANLVVETDGRRFHASAAKRRRDKRKDEHIEAQGLTVRHLRWADVVDRPAEVAAQLWPLTSRR